MTPGSRYSSGSGAQDSDTEESSQSALNHPFQGLNLRPSLFQVCICHVNKAERHKCEFTQS